jgi:hypothetical protein
MTFSYGIASNPSSGAAMVSANTAWVIRIRESSQNIEVGCGKLPSHGQRQMEQ